MCYKPRQDYFIKFLEEPLPIESSLVDNLRDILNAEIDAQEINSKPEAVDWLTWTFMYRRLSPNPNYYNLSGRTPQHINDYMSCLVEDTIEDLQEAGCVVVSEENDLDLESGNLGTIAAFYGIQY
jgi:pre-mRNA-splicing helicase BRR2